MSAVKKRSIRIVNHNTSISLEDEFWDELILIAVKEHKTLNRMIYEIDKDRGENNLSSEIRLFVLHRLKDDLEQATLNLGRHSRAWSRMRRRRGYV